MTAVRQKKGTQLTASHENPGPNSEFDDDCESIVDPSAYSREVKKKNIVNTQTKETDVTALLEESILNHEERVKQRALDGKKVRKNQDRKKEIPYIIFHYHVNNNG